MRQLFLTEFVASDKLPYPLFFDKVDFRIFLTGPTQATTCQDENTFRALKDSQEVSIELIFLYKSPQSDKFYQQAAIHT